MNYINSRFLFIYIILLLLILLIQVINVYYKSKIDEAPRLTQFLKKYGHYKIINMDLCQQPLSSLIKNAFYYTSLGTIKKDFLQLEKKGDILYHPYLILTVIEPESKGSTKIKEYAKPIYLIFEKIATAAIRFAPVKDINTLTTVGGTNNKTQCIYNIIPEENTNITLNDLIRNGQKVLESEFNSYHCSENNCQRFLKGLLLESPETSQLLKNDLIKNQIQDFLQKQISLSGDLLTKYKGSQGIVNGLVEILAFIEYWKHGK
jgi:hypothetical protein